MDQEITSYPLVLWLQEPRQKVAVVGSPLIPEQSYPEVLSLDHQQGEMNSGNIPRSRHIMLVLSDW